MTALDKTLSTASDLNITTFTATRSLHTHLLLSPNESFPDCITQYLTMEEANPELETFRQQWRAEVSARAQAEPNKATKPKATRRPPPITSLSSSIALKPVKEDEDLVEPQKAFSLDGSSSSEEHATSSSGNKPQSALDHYEKAVERESQGSLGESLDLYRKAFRVCSMSLRPGSLC